jgi:hypothetical protein
LVFMKNLLFEFFLFEDNPSDRKCERRYRCGKCPDKRLD